MLFRSCLYTERGQILITLHSDRLVIEDNGPGVPENVRARLFERFVRGADSPHVGSGLGLAIVKRVADHMGWQIHHESPPVGGSRFTLQFSDANTL